MMARILPYPALAAGLVLMWLMLSGFTRGQFVLALLVGIGASHALSALGEASPRPVRVRPLLRLFALVLYDILRSNLAVATIILSGKRPARKSGFVTMPLRLRSPHGLTVLALVLTSTPGTAWLDYNSARGELLIHVFDLIDEDEWKETIGNRYENLLLEAFE